MQKNADRAAATRIAHTLNEAGHEALFAGGSVRDGLRGVTPNDYDIATSARPEQVQALFDKTVPVGAAYGVVLVVDAEDAVCQVATFREDVGVLDGRHPAEVRFVDAETDARRRDFTINGMFENPRSGEILDFVGGRADLRARVIRCIGEPDQRFREDRLRMLRAVRFATVLDFVVDPATADVIRDQSACIRDVSAERVRDELNAILVSGRGGRGIGLLHDYGLLDPLLPEIAALDGVRQPPQFHPEGDVFTHTRMLLDDYTEGGLDVALGALLHDVGKGTMTQVSPDGKITSPGHAEVGAEMSETIMRRLRYSAAQIHAVKELVARHMDFPAVPKMREAKRRRFLMRDDFAAMMELHRLDCGASHRKLDLYEYCMTARAALDAEPPPLEPLVSGHDLKAWGFRPGPEFGTILQTVADAQLEETVRTPEEAKRYVLERFGPPPAGEEPS